MNDQFTMGLPVVHNPFSFSFSLPEGDVQYLDDDVHQVRDGEVGDEEEGGLAGWCVKEGKW